MSYKLRNMEHGTGIEYLGSTTIGVVGSLSFLVVRPASLRGLLDGMLQSTVLVDGHHDQGVGRGGEGEGGRGGGGLYWMLVCLVVECEVGRSRCFPLLLP